MSLTLSLAKAVTCDCSLYGGSEMDGVNSGSPWFICQDISCTAPTTTTTAPPTTTTIAGSTTTTTPLICSPTGSLTGILTPDMSLNPSPLAYHQFYIYCPTQNGGVLNMCVSAFADGSSYGCPFVHWDGTTAIFLCNNNVPAGSRTARCSSDATGSCCIESKSLSYTVQPAPTCGTGAGQACSGYTSSVCYTPYWSWGNLITGCSGRPVIGGNYCEYDCLEKPEAGGCLLDQVCTCWRKTACSGAYNCKDIFGCCQWGVKPPASCAGACVNKILSSGGTPTCDNSPMNCLCPVPGQTVYCDSTDSCYCYHPVSGTKYTAYCGGGYHCPSGTSVPCCWDPDCSGYGSDHTPKVCKCPQVGCTGVSGTDYTCVARGFCYKNLGDCEPGSCCTADDNPGPNTGSSCVPPSSLVPPAFNYNSQWLCVP